MWLYKFLINVLEDKWCIGPGCTTCGSLEFRAKLISNLNCFKENIDPSQLLRNNQNSLIGPVYAAAVILNESTNTKILKDSKTLSKEKNNMKTHIEAKPVISLT